MNFILGSVPPEKEEKESLLFLFKQNELLVRKIKEQYNVPTNGSADYSKYLYSNMHYIGNIDKQSCYTAKYIQGQELKDDMEFLTLRQLFGQMDESILQAAFRAIQIVAWDDTHKFCGVCAAPTEKKSNEHAKVCPNCGHIAYPRLSPAVIVAVTKGDKLLLASNKNFTSTMYSVLAGFVEAGESLEECVKREIKEEVSIEVKNIKYFGSQSWPFPNSFMIGFTAEYESGEIKVDENELSDARWFSVKELPNIPGSISISRKLIDWYVQKYKE